MKLKSKLNKTIAAQKIADDANQHALACVRELYRARLLKGYKLNTKQKTWLDAHFALCRSVREVKLVYVVWVNIGYCSK